MPQCTFDTSRIGSQNLFSHLSEYMCAEKNMRIYIEHVLGDFCSWNEERSLSGGEKIEWIHIEYLLQSIVVMTLENKLISNAFPEFSICIFCMVSSCSALVVFIDSLDGVDVVVDLSIQLILLSPHRHCISY